MLRTLRILMLLLAAGAFALTSAGWNAAGARALGGAHAHAHEASAVAGTGPGADHAHAPAGHGAHHASADGSHAPASHEAAHVTKTHAAHPSAGSHDHASGADASTGGHDHAGEANPCCATACHMAVPPTAHVPVFVRVAAGKQPLPADTKGVTRVAQGLDRPPKGLISQVG
ncbi:hypothetical protein ABLE93_02685 [Xanthobacter sp. KR7-65]|uniref:hypothetical protein n=1 Tax=Xanthobacter sp. KR7-65 TaxID=3156612 RepID=UPI0032B32EE0